ncbi:hypothetical protein CHUAL_009872 [Chamberlinius hualienensis]
MAKYICQLSSELQEKSRKELNEDPQRRDEDIEILRRWLSQEQHIVGRDDNEFLLKFLRPSKFSIETAKQKLDNYYTMKSALPDWFSNRDIQQQSLQDLLNTGVYVPLGYNNDGQRVLLCRPGVYDPTKYKPDDLIKMIFMIFEWLLLDEQTQICGIVILADANKASPALLGQFTPPVANKIMTCWQDSMPMRLKGIHFYNTSPVLDIILNIFKRFMKEKLLSRFAFCVSCELHGSNLESLHETFPVDILPSEYGGTGPQLSVSHEKFVNALNSQRDYFIKEEKYKVNENDRITPPKIRNILLGTDGTFRKLDID